MEPYTPEQWEQAENEVRKRAARYAYQSTNHITDQAVQHSTFEILLEGMVLGARMMQEELQNLNT